MLFPLPWAGAPWELAEVTPEKPFPHRCPVPVPLVPWVPPLPWLTLTVAFRVLPTEGPCLIHSMNGDLLRTLEAPGKCLKPRLIQASREGHCVIFYGNGGFCTFSVNGKLQATVDTEDNIRVSGRLSEGGGAAQGRHPVPPRKQ